MRPASQWRRSQRATDFKSCGSGSEQAPRGAAAPRGERWEPPRAGARPPGVTEGGWRKMRDLLPPLYP